MGFRSASILTLIISGIIIGCTDAVSTNYHDRTSYYSDKAIETQYVSSSERTSDVSEDIRLYAHQIKSAIEKQFGDASKYSGKECTLRMHMARPRMAFYWRLKEKVETSIYVVKR